MYGMVNKAVKELVTEQFGADNWEKIKVKANAPEDFVGFQSYDDALTYNLVGAAVEVLGLPGEKILFAFGEYWVLKIAALSYNDLMTSTGTGFVSFLENIDGMHSRIKATMPDLNPPSFRVKKLGEEKVQIDYFSNRAGLIPFVEGLLSGLGTYYKQTYKLSHVAKEDNPLPSDRMILEFI
jgi:hypothetical protein